MLTAAWTNRCNARADFGSDADTLSTDRGPNIDPGCGGGRSSTIVTASKAVCFPSGPAPTRHVYNSEKIIQSITCIRREHMFAEYPMIIKH